MCNTYGCRFLNPFIDAFVDVLNNVLIWDGHARTKRRLEDAAVVPNLSKQPFVQLVLRAVEAFGGL